MSRRLRDLNTDDLLRAAGLTRFAARFPAVRRLFDGPSQVLAERLTAFDQRLGTGRIADAAGELLSSLGTQIRISGAPVASTGPRLFLANHPGLGDILALLVALGRPDLRIVARERTFLRALPNLLPLLFLVPDRGAWGVLRQVERHLEDGGCVLTFPAGQIEPDPAWADPSASWNHWSDSTALWARRVPQLTVQPLMVGGVRARAFVDPWAARWRRQAEDREWTAAVLQLIFQVFWACPSGARIDVVAGEPLTAGDWRAGEGASWLIPILSSLAVTLRRR